MSDILLVLSNGTVTVPPLYDEVFGNYKYRVSRPTLDEDLATAVVVILTEDTVLVLTIFGNGD